MRWVAFVPMVLAGCTSTPDTPPHVDAPVVACTVQTCEPPDAGTDALAWLPTCDGGPAQWNECTLPPSVCADSHWAAYFDDGTCVKGKCELVTKYHYCDTGCSGGACIFHGSTAAGRGF